MYTLEDLEAAKAEVEKWGNAFANEKSNNPNVYLAQRRDADIKLRQIEGFLKNQGLIQKTEEELLNEELDAHYPNAKSKTVVFHKGRSYKIAYFPLVQSRSRKTVKEWGHSWKEV